MDGLLSLSHLPLAPSASSLFVSLSLSLFSPHARNFLFVQSVSFAAPSRSGCRPWGSPGATHLLSALRRYSCCLYCNPSHPPLDLPLIRPARGAHSRVTGALPRPSEHATCTRSLKSDTRHVSARGRVIGGVAGGRGSAPALIDVEQHVPNRNTREA